MARVSRTARSTAGRGWPRSTRSAATVGVRVDVDDFPPRHDRAPARLAARDDGPSRPTTPSAARTCARITVLARSPTCGRRRSTSCCACTHCPTRDSGSLLWRAVLGAWTPDHGPDLRSGCMATPRRRCARPTTPRGPPPDQAYEAAVHAAGRLHRSPPSPAGAGGLAARRRARPVQTLAAKLLALTMPGVPDVYQGSELWETSLVDPTTGDRSTSTTAAAVLAGKATTRSTSCTSPAALTSDGTSPTCSRRSPRCSPRVPRPTTCSPSTAAARSPSRPGCRSGLAAAGSWGHDADAPAGRVARRADRHPRRHPGSPTCSATCRSPCS